MNLLEKKLPGNIVNIPLFLTFATAVFLVCFWDLSSAPVEAWDEGTNMNVVYETLESGNFLTLKFNDQPFFEKPPLWYWLSMGSVKLFAFNEFALRIVSAVAGFLLILLIFYFGYKFFSFWTGLVSGAVMLATGQLFENEIGVFNSHSLRSADLDGLQLLFIFLAFFALCLGTKKSKGKLVVLTRWFLAAAVFSALAFMVKGPFALLPAVLLFLFIVVNRNSLLAGDTSRYRLHKRVVFLSLMIFLTLVLPWHVYQWARFGNDFLGTYFGFHVISRAVQGVDGHDANALFYLKILANKKAFFSIEFLAVAIGCLTFKKNILRGFKIFGVVVGSVFVLFLISLMQTKLSWYLFYVYPFAAIVVGIFFQDFVLCGSWLSKSLKAVTGALIGFLLILGVAMNLYSVFTIKSGRRPRIEDDYGVDRAELFYEREGEINSLSDR